MDARQRAIYVRDTLVDLLAQEAAGLAAEPEPGKHSDKLLHVLTHLEAACTATMQAVSESSHPSYTERDLPSEVADDWRRAKHSMRLARLLYAPQPKVCDDPGAHA